jgi:two-component system cell cycle response regulator
MAYVSLDDILVCPNLPSLPAVAVRLLELTSDPDVAISEIAKLVQQDQALAAKVLKTVNSSFYGLMTPCGSIDRAMGYLGLNTVKSLVLGFSLVETTRNASVGGFDFDRHWRRAIISATGARIIAKALGGIDPEDAFTASLFQDMGMLACFATMKESYSKVISGVVHRDLSDRERSELGYDHAEVGSALAARWKLPEEIVTAIRYHHDPDACSTQGQHLVRAVALGARICDCLETDAPSSCMRTFERVSRGWYGSKFPETGHVLNEVSETSKTLAKMFEQDIGTMPSSAEIMSKAQEQELEHQVSMQRRSDELAREVLVDGLTQVANRKRFDAELSRMYDAYTKDSVPFGVIFFDADKFKSVNDTYGHTAGDVVLMELAHRTTETVGQDGIVFRYGGEEFAVLVQGRSIDWCADLGERVRMAFASRPFDLRGVEGVPDELPVTASIGVSSTDAGQPERLSSADQVVQEADDCVYAAKADGRNNVKVFGQKKVDSGLDLQASLGTGVPDSSSQPSLKKSTIMLVEDDSLAATLVISLLKRRSNVDVTWFKSGT